MSRKGVRVARLAAFVLAAGAAWRTSFDAWLLGTGDEFEHAETWLELPAAG